ncbi:MAG TPA: hypothetical protein DCL61_21105 [Cyanobacteria bacterium UBA12227]|nr:hypothetical protein [Cyanobacteria bacterium UBA12227]HAX84734.1 hypothetical protein [Cyanobacteria bacterium UBA11370]HBY80957.1 hypothetical protein [Cyanobacteria bacterium UBA11148]
MKKAILGSLAVLPLVVGGVFTNASSASAAALVGEFSISPGINSSLPLVTNSTLFSNKINFSPNPGGVFVTNQTGTFSSFDAATIKSIPAPLIPSNGGTKDSPLLSNFLDLGQLSGPFANNATTNDGQNTFSLLSIGSYSIEEMFDNNGNFTGTSISLGVSGFFTSADGQMSNGAGTVTFQSTLRKPGVLTAMASSNGLNASFSGVFISASVPEPTTLVGLGLVAGSLVMSRRGKKNQAE